MPLLKAVAVETDAINIAESTPVADATKVVDEGTRKKIPENRKSMNSQKAVAAGTDATNMAESTPVADATKVVDAGTRQKIPEQSNSTNSWKEHTVEVRRKRTSKKKLVSVSLVADALVVTHEDGGKGMGEKSRSQKLNQVDSDAARRSGKCKKREAAPLVTMGETDAQYLAEVAETDAVLAAFKRRWSERRRRRWHAAVSPDRGDDSLWNWSRATYAFTISMLLLYRGMCGSTHCEKIIMGGSL